MFKSSLMLILLVCDTISNVFTEALGAIWALSFDDENRKMMVNDESLGVVARLSELKDSDNYKIKTAANGALWNLRDNLRQSTDTTFRGLGNEGSFTHLIFELMTISAEALDFQQFDILTSVDSDEPVQPPFKLRNSKWCSVSSLINIEYSSD